MPDLKRWALFTKTTRTGLPLWLEIALVLVIKVALLFFLWKLFFSHPQTRHMALPTPVVEQQLLSPHPPASTPTKPAALSRVRYVHQIAHQMFAEQIIDVERCARRTLASQFSTFTFKAPHGSD